MNTLNEAAPLGLWTGTQDVETMFLEEETADREIELLQRLEQMPEGSVMAIDLSKVRLASAAARRLLRRALLRLRSGELPGRFLVLEDTGESEYSVEAMLLGEELVMVERTSVGPRLLGDIDSAVEETYRVLLKDGQATAGSIQRELGLTNISTATNRLSKLAQLGLAWRVEQRPASGGGREYVYAPVR
jgi:hypothetical protein